LGGIMGSHEARHVRNTGQRRNFKTRKETDQSSIPLMHNAHVMKYYSEKWQTVNKQSLIIWKLYSKEMLTNRHIELTNV